MSAPIERLAARWRRTPRAAVPDDARRRAAEHDATHAGGGYLMPERLNAPIPANLHGPVQDESVVVSLPAVPSILSQQALNEYLLTALEALAAATATGAPNYVYWTPDAAATDPEWLTYDGAALRWEG